MPSIFQPLSDWAGAGNPGSALSCCLCAFGFVICAAAAFPGSVFGGERGRVREPILAGTWYEAGSSALAESIDARLEGHGRPPAPRPETAAQARTWTEAGRLPVALIVPHAGHMYSGPCAGQAFGLLRGSGCKRVILLGPSHRVAFSGAALPEEDAFRTPLGTVRLDRAAIDRLAKEPGFQVLPRAHAGEHSLEIELPFLQRVLGSEFALIPIVVGRMDAASLRSIGNALAGLWVDGTVIVASSDFTHYGPGFDYVPFTDDVPDRLRKLDLGAVARIASADLEGFSEYRASTGATICGAEPIRILLEAARGRSLQGRLIDYYRSGDLTGDFGSSVSYAAIAFFPPEASGASATGRAAAHRELNRSEQDLLLGLARKTVRALVSGEPLPSETPPSELPADSPLREERGVFVTLNTRSGDLRGCIGSIFGERPLYSGIVQNAVASASRDPRFSPVTRLEEPDLEIEISVLTPLRAVDSAEEIVAGRDGVLLEKNGRRAVFLPQVAPEQGWDVPEMLRHLSMKAGLRPDEWRSGASFQIFQAQVFGETRSTH